jgi:hypothetical protein
VLAEQFSNLDDIGRPFVSKALAACSKRVVVLSACARITDAHVLQLTMRPADFAALAALKYVALLAHGTYGSFVDEVPLAHLKQLQEIHI